jgi:aldehyde dehydrogenase (NAD(P)+)
LCPGHGRRPTYVSRPNTWPPRNCTTAVSTASPRRSSCCPATGTAPPTCSTRCAPSCTPPPPRPAYYPSAEDRRLAAIAQYRGSEQLGARGATRTLITSVDPNDAKAHAFTEEFFGPVQATTELPGRDAAEFLRNAVHFANNTLHGTLGANLIIHPQTIAEVGPALEDAIAELRYGTVAVNAWTGVGYLTPRASWGAFPGHTYNDIQSGIGVVHNALFFDRPQKTVVRALFRPFPRSVRHAEFTLSPRPPWFVTNRTADVTGRRLTYHAADGKLRRLPGILASALPG